MSFDTDEKSVQGSRPRELWLITTPTETYRYTTAEVSVVYGGNTYVAIPGARSEVTGASIGDVPEMQLQLPASNAFVQSHAFGMPPQEINLVIYRLQGSAAVTWWSGPITDFAIDKNNAKVRSPSQLSDALDGTIPSANLQRQCNHMLYDDRCTVDRTSVANKLTTTVSSISTDGLTIVVASIGTFNNHLKGGELWRVTGSDKRIILDQQGTTLVINAPFRTIATGNSMQLYRGCKHDIADCAASFGNAINFGGHPYMPTVNPFKGDLRGNPFT